jgi:hypothetical protein
MRLLPLGISLILATACFADIITLKSGRIINGTYLGGTSREVKVQIGDNVETLDLSQVVRIEFGNGDSAPAPNPDRPVLRRAGDSSSAPRSSSSDSGRPTLVRGDQSSSNYPPPNSSSSDSGRPTLMRGDQAPSNNPPASSDSSDDSRPSLRRGDPAPILRPDNSASSSSTASSVAAPAAPVELAAGANFVVRMIDAVDSQKASSGQSFAATMAEPIVVNGQTVVPRGADVVVKLVEAKQSGTFTGKTELTLSLASVKVNGRSVDINTQNITRESESRGAKTATTAGGGAVVGAVIGAIAGGGKGAAVGAAAGGAAGAGVQVVTKGERIKIPSETRLTFVLDAPVTI